MLVYGVGAANVQAVAMRGDVVVMRLLLRVRA